MTVQPHEASGSFKIYLPCLVISVQAVLGPKTGTSRLQQLVLRAIAHGANSIGELNRIFCLGQRPMLRLILAMVQHGHLRVDYETGLLSLAGQAVEAVQKNSFDQLQCSETRPRTIELMYDLIAGTVSRKRKAPWKRKEGYTLESRLPETSYRKVEGSSLLRAASEVTQDWTTKGGRGLRILELNLDLKQALGETTDETASYGERRLLELEIRLERDPASGYIQIFIHYPNDLGGLVRRHLERELTHLVNLEEPPTALKQVRDHPGVPEKDGLPDLGDRIALFRTRVRRLETADPGTYDVWQGTLAEIAERLASEIAEHNRHLLEPRIVSDRQTQIDLIMAMIGRSKRQLVISCPFLGYDMLQPYRVALKKALDEGVQCFLLSGLLHRSEHLDQGTMNWFSDLREMYPDRFFYCKKPANAHAKFVISDASELFVTSYNFLNSSPVARTFELGCWVGVRETFDRKARRSAGALQAVISPALHALAISHEIFPDVMDRQNMVHDAMDFGADDISGTVSPWPRRPTLEGADTETTRQVDRIWMADWFDYCERLLVEFDQLGTTFEVLRGAKHRQVLFHALRTAERRVFILSDRLTKNVINRKFVDEISACLKRSVAVSLICQRPESKPLNTLRALNGTVEGARLDIFIADGSPQGDLPGSNHAKLLIFDDTAVISSLNFLSFAADDSGPERLRVSTEIGVMMRGHRVIETLFAMLRERWPGLSIPTELPATRQAAKPIVQSVGAAPSINSQDATELIQTIARAVQEGDARAGTEAQPRVLEDLYGEHLHQWFSAATSAGKAQRLLQGLHIANPPFMDQAFAAFLSQWGDHLEETVVESWTAQLAERLWRQGRAMETLLLSYSLPSGSPEPRSLSKATPPLRIAELLARCELGLDVEAAFDNTVLHFLETGDRTAFQAIAAIAIPRLLFDDRPPNESVELVRDHLEDGLATWAAAALEFRTYHPQRLNPDSIRALTEFEQLQNTRDELRRDLSDQLDKTCNLKLDFKLFKLVWPNLRRGELGLDHLHEAVAQDDLKTIKAFVESSTTRYGSGRRAASRMLDIAVEESAQAIAAQYRKFTGKFRQLCIEHLSRVLTLTRDWVRLTEATEVEITPSFRRLVLDLGSRLRASHEDVNEALRAAHRRGTYDEPLIERMIKELDTISKLGDPLA